MHTFSTPSGTIDIERTDKALKSFGGFTAFAGFLKRSGIIEKLVETCPIDRTSGNATSIRDLLLSFMLTCICEGSRFRHVRFIQNDATLKRVFKLDRRICSEDSFRRFFEMIDTEAGKKWLDGAFEILFSALPEMFIIDWDSTITTRYGDQEGVAVGYNPMKPGRGSHHPLICTVAEGMTVLLDDLLSRLPASRRAFITRGDVGFSGEKVLNWFETRGKHEKPYYVFKLKKSTRIMEAIRTVTELEWNGAMSFGALQIMEKQIKLTTWNKERRIILGRRLVCKETPEDSGTLFGTSSYEYCAFVTNLSPEQYQAWQIAEIYQQRADCENIFDELKNQWVLAGFCSQKQNVTELAARFTVLSYNIWSLFVRFFSTRQHREAKTSRRDVLMFPAQLSESGRDRTLKVAVFDYFWNALTQVRHFIRQNAK